MLTCSTASYFGGTGVVSYVSSKHGLVGLLRSSQATAKEIGVRLNAVAPTLTPTHITSGYSKAWIESGIPANEPSDVAAAIAQISVDSAIEGTCCLVRVPYSSIDNLTADIISRLSERRCSKLRSLELK